MSAFHCDPTGPAKGGLVVLQEIFGVNSHIREVTERWAAQGFEAIAPALFDPIEKNVELGYTAQDFPRGRELIQKLGFEGARKGVELAIGHLKGRHEKVFVVGYCWGGSLAFMAACRSEGVTKAAAYYGRHIHEFRHERPKVPVILHYGRHDPSIPMEQVEDVRQAHPNVSLYVYEAGHGFNCDHRPDYNRAAAEVAAKRTFAFFAES